MMPAQKPHRSKQDYGTPLAFLDAVRKRFGLIAADLAATSRNRVVTEFYDSDSGAEGSLSQTWAEDYPVGNLWLNPPFTNLGEWARKCSFEAPQRDGFILLLTPASVGSNWFAEHVHDKAMVFALRPRLTFVGCTDPYPKDLILSVYGMGMRGFDCWRWQP